MNAIELEAGACASRAAQPSKSGVYTALFVTGFGTFVNVYSPQPLLPSLREAFHASELLVSLTISAPVLAVALAAPLVGMLADAVGRKRVIVASMIGLSIPTLLSGAASGLGQLIFWRFLQGIFVPGIIAVAMAYISEESHHESVGKSMSKYVAGTIVGGFAGRLVAGAVEPLFGWRMAFVALGLITLALALTTWKLLPRSVNFKAQPDPRSSIASMLRHLRNPQLLATYAAGFNILFLLVGVFTYVNFHLADSPYKLGSAALAWIFSVYLIGAYVTSWAGRMLDKSGCRKTLLCGIAMAAAGVAITLIPSVPAIIAGLAVAASGAFVSQTAAASHVGKVAGTAKSSATGLYVSIYYFGGCMGAVLPGVFWRQAGWTGCVAMMILVQCVIAMIAIKAWKQI